MLICAPRRWLAFATLRVCTCKLKRLSDDERVRGWVVLLTTRPTTQNFILLWFCVNIIKLIYIKLISSRLLDFLVVCHKGDVFESVNKISKMINERRKNHFFINGDHMK